MAVLSLNHKPSFIWQALLILFPVVVLAAIGFVSIHQDKQLVQREAADRAQAIADDLLPRLWAELTETDNPHRFETNAFRINAAGELVYPPPIAPFPTPRPLDPNELSPD